MKFKISKRCSGIFCENILPLLRLLSNSIRGFFSKLELKILYLSNKLETHTYIHTRACTHTHKHNIESWARETTPFQNMHIIEHFKNKPLRAMCFLNVHRHLNIQPFRRLQTSKGTLITINFRIIQPKRKFISYFCHPFFSVLHSTIIQKNLVMLSIATANRNTTTKYIITFDSWVFITFIILKLYTKSFLFALL